MRTILLLTAALTCAFFAGESRAIAEESSSQGSVNSAGSANLSSQEGAAARRLYQVKCARCHKFYDPAAYTDAEWSMWMNKMAKKSKLKPDQKDLLARYLETFRVNSRANGSEPVPSKTGRAKSR